MPCRASPPPPPPPHSTLDLTPTPIALSNPLVYRLRTCCLQEFLPRLAIIQHTSSILPTTSTAPSSPPISCTFSTCASIHPSPSHCSSSPLSTINHATTRSSPRHRHRSNATQLSALFADKHYITSGIVTSTTNRNGTSSSPHLHDDNLPQDEPSFLSASISKWQPPASSIPLSQLQSALAHRFLRWALSEELVDEPLEEEQEHQEIAINQTSIDDAATEKLAQQMSTLATVGQDWAAAHDLVWAEGDYYMAQKTCIREGVAHLKRGRRYIFVEPVLGPASTYLYPKWTDHSATAAEDQSESEAYDLSEGGMHETSSVGFDHSATANSDALVASASPTTTNDQPHYEHDQEQDKNQNDETPELSDVAPSTSTFSSEGDMERDTNDSETEDRAQTGLAALPCDNERIEKEELEGDVRDNATTANTSASATETVDANNASTNASVTVSSSNNANSSSSTSDLDDDSDHILDMSKLLEPYSPLLDPSADGQDQFEYGLYELQYIPKIQHLLPQQFLPTRQSFIVHLDEDRPTLASPVPIHSKRSECRCQLMMRKALMQENLLQVWPPIAPVRTLQEKQQEAEEEARIMEIKQKVQMQTKNWRETLQTQIVAC
ncbi:hypothetical protein BGX27_001538 [Mortierella sp. AM989]|nr:hypothetical protein BGX27_001538 [Mortierella sp. AM989]